jgi:hypothetical protein
MNPTDEFILDPGTVANKYKYTLSRYVKVGENMQKTLFLTIVLHGVYYNRAFRNSYVLAELGIIGDNSTNRQ